MTRLPWSGLLVLLLTSCSLSPRMVADQQTSALGDLDYLIGTWVAAAEDPRTGRTFRLDYEVRPVLGGNWLAGRGRSAELGIEVQDFWGRDAVSGEVIRTMFQSDGSYGIIRSPGWEGDVLRFEGESHGGRGTLRVRETITRVSTAEFRAVWEAYIEGTWTTYSIERLIRQSE